MIFYKLYFSSLSPQRFLTNNAPLGALKQLDVVHKSNKQDQCEESAQRTAKDDKSLDQNQTYLKAYLKEENSLENLLRRPSPIAFSSLLE